MELTIFAAIAAGIITMASAYGIGKIGSSALESIARQPEASDQIRGTMIIAAALIEGIALFGLVICIIFALK